MLLMKTSWTMGLLRIARPSAAGNRRIVAGDVQLLADDAQAGRGDLAPEADDPHLLEQVVLLGMALTCELDERVLVRRLLQRPCRVPRQELEGGEGSRPSDQQMQRNRAP